VTGTAGSSNITYTNETNGTSSVRSGYSSDGKMFWEKTVSLKSGDTAYVTAQNNSRDGTVVAEIWYGDTLVKRSESSGEYCIATVAGRIE
jgi:hypothetical protein